MPGRHLPLVHGEGRNDEEEKLRGRSVHTQLGRFRPSSSPETPDLFSPGRPADQRDDQVGCSALRVPGYPREHGCFQEARERRFWKGGMIGDEAGVFESAGNRKMTMLRMRDVADVP